MVNPTLWGPPLWQALFACAWHAPTASKGAKEEERAEAADALCQLKTLLLHQVPLLLPCAKCQLNYATHRPDAARRAKGEVTSPQQAVAWLYHLKNAVNETLCKEHRRGGKHGRCCTPLPFADLQARLAFHGATVDEVQLADALVLVALEAQRATPRRDAVFVAFCHTLARLLPLPADSQLKVVLAGAGQGELAVCPGRTVVNVAFKAAVYTRKDLGIPLRQLEAYKKAASDETS